MNLKGIILNINQFHLISFNYKSSRLCEVKSLTWLIVPIIDTHSFGGEFKASLTFLVVEGVQQITSLVYNVLPHTGKTLVLLMTANPSGFFITLL